MNLPQLPDTEEGYKELVAALKQNELAVLAGKYALTMDDFLKDRRDSETALCLSGLNNNLSQTAAVLGLTPKEMLPHLRKADYEGWTAFHVGAQLGAPFFDYLMTTGEKLLANDFLAENVNAAGTLTPLGLARTNGNLPVLFNTKYWLNNAGEMLKLWEQVPEEYRDKVEDFDERLQKVIRDSQPKWSESMFSGAVKNAPTPGKARIPSRELVV